MCSSQAQAGQAPHCNGTSVCLVEAGPDYGPRDGGDRPADMLDARIIPPSHSWERLDPDDYRETLVRRIDPSWLPGGLCTRTYTRAGDFEAMDNRVWKPR